MAFLVPEDVYTETKDITNKNKDFKRIKQTSGDTTFIKGAYTYIFNNKDHSIGIRVRTGDDN